MTDTRCPHCRGRVNAATRHCILCGVPYQAPARTYKPGDVIRIRNRFKGGKVEDVTIVRVQRDGHGIEVKDQNGLSWGYIFPAEIVEPARR